MNVDEYIKLGLHHSIHTSERKAFRACRRRWNWSYRQGYHPKVTPKPLEFGIAVHRAFEVWYDPQTWFDDRDTQSSLAIAAFKQVCDSQLKTFRELNGEPEEEVLTDYRERVDLGVDMVRYYTKNVSPIIDKGLTPLAVEIPFEVPMGFNCKCDSCWIKYRIFMEAPDPKDNHYIDSLKYSLMSFHTLAWSSDGEYYKAWEGLPVTFGGRIDAIIKDSRDRIYCYDWKAQPIDEKILTPTGWTQMGSLKVGDYVIGSNGHKTKVTGIYPQGEKEVFNITTSDGSTVKATGDHLWTIYAKNYNRSKTMTTIEIITELNKNNPIYLLLPELQPVNYEPNDDKITLDSYVLGLLIGDGGFTDRTIKFSNSDGLESYLPYQCNRISEHLNDFRLIGAISDIKRLGLDGHKSIDKFIPRQYMVSSVQNRLKLVQGLMDTDGYVSKGNALFCTSSYKLRDDFVELINSLGGKALVFNDGLRHNANAESYQISVKLPLGLCPFFADIKHKKGRWRKGPQTHRKIISKVEPYKTTEVQCIMVEAKDSLYVTRDYILTHNTTARILDDEDEAAFLQLDDQVGGYPVALYKMGRRIDGFIYHEQRKAVPVSPKQLKRPYQGKLYSTDKTATVEYDSFFSTILRNDLGAYNAGLYDEYLKFLMGPMAPKFYQRHTIYKTEEQMDNFWNDLIAEAHDMLEQPRIYPQASRFSCNSCLYRQPCEGKNRNEDYKYTLDSNFIKELR